MERIQSVLQSTAPAIWIFEGDSITHGALHTFGWRDYTEQLTERIRFELGRSRDVIIKTAVSGHTTRDLLGDFDWRVRQFHPTVVFLMFGMNDCASDQELVPAEFRSNLRSLCRSILDDGSALPVLQTTCPIMPGGAPNRERNFDAYMDIIREVAVAVNAPLIDHTKYWRERFVQQADLHSYWMSDAFHPNNYGHNVFAECLLKELGIFDPKSKVCQLFHP